MNKFIHLNQYEKPLAFESKKAMWYASPFGDTYRPILPQGSNSATAPILKQQQYDQTNISGTLGGVNDYNRINMVGYNSPTKSVLPAATTTTNKTNNTSSAPRQTGLDPHINPSTGLWDDNYFASQQTANQDDSALINEMYNSSYDYLNKVEQNLRGQLPGTLETLNQDYNLNNKILGDANKANSAQLNFQGEQAAQADTTQEAKIRRLYNELRMGYNQRFGGSTSAGGAASEISNVEQQRQTGQLAQQFNNTQQVLAQKKEELETNFQNTSQKLLQAKQQAIQQANQDFSNKLLEIAGNRTQIDQQKALAKYQALVDLKNKIFTIDQQNKQFEQTLKLNKENMAMQLDYYQKTGGAATTAGTNAGTNFTTGLQQPTSGLTVQGLQQGFQSGGLTPLQGSISSKDPYAQLQGQVSSNNSFDYLKQLGLS